MNESENKSSVEYRGYTIDLQTDELNAGIKAVITDAINRVVYRTIPCHTVEGAVIAAKNKINDILTNPARVDPVKANEGLRQIAKDHLQIIDSQQTRIEELNTALRDIVNIDENDYGDYADLVYGIFLIARKALGDIE